MWEDTLLIYKDLEAFDWARSEHLLDSWEYQGGVSYHPDHGFMVLMVRQKPEPEEAETEDNLRKFFLCTEPDGTGVVGWVFGEAESRRQKAILEEEKRIKLYIVERGKGDEN